MGYESRHHGEITITPPLTWAEIRSARSPGLRDVRLKLRETVTDTDTGQIREVCAVAIQPITEESYNGYEIQAELQAVVDAHPSHEFTGAMYADGPEGNHWRYRVAGRVVVNEEPRLVWPDEEAQA